MKTTLTRSATVLVTLGIIAGSFGYPSRAEAILGIADTAVVIDPAHIAETIAGQIANAARFILEQSLKRILSNLKKRLLDTMTDQVTTWIKGGGKPRFVTNFGDILSDAAGRAVGDTVQEIRQVSFTDPDLRSLLEGSVSADAARSFVDRLTPTLPDVVPSVEQFRANFDAGGFLAYRELFNPQNNPWGVQMIAAETLPQNLATEAEKAKLEQVAEQGFEGQKRCLVWTRGVLMREGPDVEQTFQPGDTGWLEKYYNMETPPPGGVRALPPNRLPGIYPWLCEPEHQERTTPGIAIAEGIKRSLYTDIDYISNNNEDVSNFLTAILDAAFNRLTNVVADRVRGFAGIRKSQTTTGVAPPRFTSTSTLLIEAEREATTTQLLIQQQLKQTLLTRVTQMIADLDALRTELPRALTKNQTGKNRLYASASPRPLLSCLSAPLRTPPVSPPENYEPPAYGNRTLISSIIIPEATQREADIRTQIARVGSIRTQLTSFQTAVNRIVLPRDLNALTSLSLSITPLQETFADFEGTATGLVSSAETFLNQVTLNLAECARTHRP